jgi:hypothetical protein
MSFDQIVEYLNPMFWLTTKAANVGGAVGQVVFIVFILIFVFGVIARFSSAKKVDTYKRITFNRIANLFVTMGLLGAFLFFLSSEHIQFFGARFWYLIWAIVFAVWGGFILHYVIKRIPCMRQAAIDRKEKVKYMPKMKKKGDR